MQRSFPTLRAAARWLLLAAVSAAAGFALGVAGQPARPSQPGRPSSLPRPPPASLRRAGARAAPPSPARPPPASQAELPPLVCLTFDDGPSRTTPAVLAALEEAEGARHLFCGGQREQRELPALDPAGGAGGVRDRFALGLPSVQRHLPQRRPPFGRTSPCCASASPPMWTTARSAACGSPGGSTNHRQPQIRRGRPHGPAEGGRRRTRAGVGWTGTSRPRTPPAKSCRRRRSAATSPGAAPGWSGASS